MTDRPSDSPLARAVRGEPLTLRGLLAAVGGWLGVVESVLPSLAFIVVYQVVALRAAPAAVPREALPAIVLPPLGLAAVFIVIRLVRRERVTTAVGGALGAGLSAVLALTSGDAKQNFLPGLLTNAGYGAALLISVLVRWPLIGVAVGLLVADERSWRADPTRRRLYTWLTLLWVALFAVRLVVEVPLFVGNQVVALGIARIVLGLPLYAPVLVLTIVTIQAVLRRSRPPS